MKLIAVILSGGSGSRLWPLSTDSITKAFFTTIWRKEFIRKNSAPIKFSPLAKKF